MSRCQMQTVENGLSGFPNGLRNKPKQSGIKERSFKSKSMDETKRVHQAREASVLFAPLGREHDECSLQHVVLGLESFHLFPHSIELGLQLGLRSAWKSRLVRFTITFLARHCETLIILFLDPKTQGLFSDGELLRDLAKDCSVPGVTKATLIYVRDCCRTHLAWVSAD